MSFTITPGINELTACIPSVKTEVTSIPLRSVRVVGALGTKPTPARRAPCRCESPHRPDNTLSGHFVVIHVLWSV